MKPFNHPWPRTVARARALQETLRSRVEMLDDFGAIEYVAGVDVGFEQDGAITRAAVAVLRWGDLSLCEYAVARRRTRFPYVPGYLSFREIPAILAALARLSRRPDLLVCDGHGYAHPRRIGLASHLGIVTDIPSIGAAKSLLIGEHAALPQRRGARRAIYDGDEIIGAALRTRTGVRPVYVSIGHRVCLETAVRFVLHLSPRYRLPETTRQAHRLASHPFRVKSAMRAQVSGRPSVR